MMYREKPEGFRSKFEVVSCFVEHEGKILLLLRQDHKSEGNTWGVPAGKVDEGESLQNAMIRENREETGLCLAPEELSYSQAVFVRFPTYDFVYHMFHTTLDFAPEIKINPEEHKELCWVSPLEALKLPLIQDEDACIKLFYKISL